MDIVGVSTPKKTMIKEIKYLVFIIIISLFLFFTIRYYFSDNNEKETQIFKSNKSKIE